MRGYALLIAAAALLVSFEVASAQNQAPQDKADAQSTTPNKSPVAIVPEPATDVAGVPRQAERSGQAPNVQCG
jgi:hypothetical protein